MCSAMAAEQERVATAVVAGTVGCGSHLDETSVGILTASCADALRDDGAAGVPSDVYHLGARVGLLVVVCHSHAVELSLRAVAREHTAWVLPRDGAARLHLRPGESAVLASQMAALRHEVEHAALAFAVARVPVLYRRVLDLSPFLHHDLDDGGVELVLVAHGCRAAFEVRDVGIIVAHDECPLELPRAAGVDAEVRAELHRAAHAFGDIDEGAVAEDGGVERGEEVVAIGDDAAQVLAHQVGVLADGLADRAEDDALLAELLAERRLDAHRVHHGIDGCSGQCHALLQRDAQLVEGLHQLRVDFLLSLLPLAPCPLPLAGRVSIVGDGLVVNLRHLEVSPSRLLKGQPIAISIQAELQQPVRFSLLLGDEAHDVLRQTLLDDVRLHVGSEAVLVLLLRHLTHETVLFFHLLLRNFQLRVQSYEEASEIPNLFD